MFDNDKDEDQRAVFILLGALLPVIIGTVIGAVCYMGSGDSSASAKTPAVAEVTTNGATGALATAATAAAAVTAGVAATANAAADAGAAVGNVAAGAVNAAATTAGATDAASVAVENGVVKFFFASGKADVAKGGNDALADVVKGVKSGQKAVISGYHDSTGDAAANAALAKRRAQAVRDAMVSLGASADSIEMKKPENAQAGTGNDANARRVEVELSK